MNEVAELKQQNRAMWAAGEYDAIAELVWEVGGYIVRRAEVASGDDVLDVACGTGNASIRAAEAGANVVGLDLTPEMFEAARSRAEAAGVRVEWVEGDAEDLPFPDESFDIVLSTFGCMFAPRHDLVARELARVLRPGGRLGLCNFTPEGAGGDFFRTVGAHLPPLPPFASPPLLWGTEEHVRELFDDTGLELEFEREEVTEQYGSVEQAVETYTTKFGPIVAARALLEPQGRWPALREDLTAMFERNLAPGESAVAYEYLVVLGRKGAQRAA
jgi:ubiquinone/menaquinone biosynthesis C-methylase UbiE